MLAIRARFLVALGLAALVLLAYLVIPGIVNSIDAAQARADLAAANTAMSRLRLPSDFVPVTTLGNNIPCLSPGRCYRVDQPTTAVEPLLPKLLRSIGAARQSFGRGCVVVAHSRFESPGGPPVESCWLLGILDHNGVAIQLQPPFATCTLSSCRFPDNASIVVITGPEPTS